MNMYVELAGGQVPPDGWGLYTKNNLCTVDSWEGFYGLRSVTKWMKLNPGKGIEDVPPRIREWIDEQNISPTLPDRKKKGSLAYFTNTMSLFTSKLGRKYWENRESAAQDRAHSFQGPNNQSRHLKKDVQRQVSKAMAATGRLTQGSVAANPQIETDTSKKKSLASELVLI